MKICPTRWSRWQRRLFAAMILAALACSSWIELRLLLCGDASWSDPLAWAIGYWFIYTVVDSETKKDEGR